MRRVFLLLLPVKSEVAMIDRFSDVLDKRHKDFEGRNGLPGIGNRQKAQACCSTYRPAT
jgi:hypothetical protein